jgi:hypothetical protein
MGAESRAMSPEQRAMAAEGIRQRRAAIGQRGQERQQQMTPESPQMAAAQDEKGPASVIPGVPAPQVNPGIMFGPGRANRMPERGTPEYQSLVNRVRNLGR